MGWPSLMAVLSSWHPSSISTFSDPFRAPAGVFRYGIDPVSRGDCIGRSLKTHHESPVFSTENVVTCFLLSPSLPASSVLRMYNHTTTLVEGPKVSDVFYIPSTSAQKDASKIPLLWHIVIRRKCGTWTSVLTTALSLLILRTHGWKGIQAKTILPKTRVEKHTSESATARQICNSISTTTATKINSFFWCPHRRAEG